jgi:hypothetical protein
MDFGGNYDNLAQDESKSCFLTELVRAVQQNPLTIVIARDFNIIRNSREKSNTTYSDMWLFLFDVVIDSFDRMEINLTSLQFTLCRCSEITG